jgi:hypothetical protein
MLMAHQFITETFFSYLKRLFSLGRKAAAGPEVTKDIYPKRFCAVSAYCKMRIADPQQHSKQLLRANGPPGEESTASPECETSLPSLHTTLSTTKCIGSAGVLSLV